LTARITAAIRRHHPIAAARVYAVEVYGGERWVAFDVDDRIVATGSLRWWLVSWTVTVRRVYS